jgi:hypothetical protein
VARHLMFRCPSTGKAARLGVTAEDGDEIQVRVGAVVMCEACNDHHTIEPSDVFFEPEADE